MHKSLTLVASLLLATAARAADAPTPKQVQVQVLVTEEGFQPSSVKVARGEPIDLVVTRKVEHTCAKKVVVKDAGISKDLPLGVPVHIALVPGKAGVLTYACGMGMYKGSLIIE
jgi:plastocyanin domain-containing protein